MTNNHFTVSIERMTFGPDAVSHLPDGRVALVRGGVPGDESRIAVTVEHARYVEAEIIELTRASADRREARCQHARSGECGGCPWQHMDETAQQREKQLIVAREIGRLSATAEVRPLTAPAPAFGYRRRARLGHKGEMLGYRRRGMRRIFDLQECPILDPRIEAELGAVRAAVRDWPSGNVDLMVDSDGEVVVGGPAASFVQASDQVEAALVSLVLAAIPKSDARVCELFSGSGAFTLPLAARGHQVTAYESDPRAVQSLKSKSPAVRVNRKDLLKPGLTLAPADAVLLDPPRKGAMPCMDAIISTGARTVCYVSCDIMTLCRDLRVLLAGGYQLDWVQPMDAFPQTHHIECVATLSLTEPPE